MKKLSGWILSLVAVSSMMACGDGEENLYQMDFGPVAGRPVRSITPNKVTGYWEESTDSLFRSRVKLEENEITVALQCTLNGELHRAQKTAPIRIESDSIVFLDGFFLIEIKESGGFCNYPLGSSVTYSLDRNRLTIGNLEYRKLADL